MPFETSVTSRSTQSAELLDSELHTLHNMVF